MLIECKYNSYGIFNDQLKIGPAKWKYFDLLFVHSGHVIIWSGDRKLELKTGQSILIYPNTEFHGHSIAESTRVSVQHFVIPNSKNRGLPDEIKKLVGNKNGFESFLNATDRQVERDIKRLISLRQSEEPGSYRDEMMSSVMTLILLGIYQARNNLRRTRNDTFDELLTFMENNLSRNISLDEMADVCGLSKSHFRASFRKFFFQPPADYFRNMRMNAAAKKLCETAIPIKEIARQLGFDMLPNFYRTFRKIYGISPAEYRKNNILRG